MQIPAAEADAFLHSWQVAAHMLGVKDEYIPATWDDADAQAPQILDPVLAPTPEGIKLADILLDLAAGRGRRRRHPPAARVADPLHPRRPDRRVAADPAPPGPGRDARRRLAAVRAAEGGRPAACPARTELYWAFDEILRQGALWYLGEGEPLYIEIPDTNNPNYSS